MCLRLLSTATDNVHITFDMYPNDMYFDDTDVQRHNNIEWKVSKASQDDVVDHIYHSEPEREPEPEILNESAYESVSEGESESHSD